MAKKKVTPREILSQKIRLERRKLRELERKLVSMRGTVRGLLMALEQCGEEKNE